MTRWLLVIFTVLSGCSSDEKNTPRLFSLLSSGRTGINFVNQLDEKKSNILEYMYYYNGGGVAVGDINNDGFPDIYFTANEGSNALFLNKGNLSFEDITVSAGVSGKGDWSTGVTMVDVNDDGLLDIYVCVVSGYKGLSGHNELYINNGDLTFTERAKEWGLDFVGFSTQACFFDYDGDGDLDVYLLNHSVHSIRSYGRASLRNEKDSHAGDRLLRNLINQGEARFEDATERSGIFSSHIGYGLGVGASDINGDGWLDLYISNDFHENDYLYINNRDGTFTESLEKWIAHTSRYSMGNDIADVNADGLPDIVTVDMLPYESAILLRSASEDLQEVHDIKRDFGYGDQYVRNCLQINRTDHFVEIAQVAGVHATDWSWAPLICDLDNDGKQDIFITNGIYKRPNDLDYIQYTSDVAKKGKVTAESDAALIRALPTLKIPNFAFRNLGDSALQDHASEWGLADPSYSNGAAYADLDNDGDLELVINNVNQSAFIYENHSRQQNQLNFLSVELQGAKGFNHFGVGARVVVHTSAGSQMKELTLCRGFQSSIEPVVHFGLGTSAKVDSVQIFWGTDGYQVARDVAINKRLTIKKASAPSLEKEGNTAQGAEVVHITIPFVHVENDFQEFASEPLIPSSLAGEGPAFGVSDVNKDGLEDLYIGGAHGQSGVLLLQSNDNAFRSSNVRLFELDSRYEDVDAFFGDLNGDSYPDLYVVSGGNQYPEGHELLKDRVYLNNGDGNFTKAVDNLPALALNGGCVTPLDFDHDGDKDLFVGTRSVPGRYGVKPLSYILRNDGSGRLSIHCSIRAGLVTDARWIDIDGDGRELLIVSAEWSPLQLFEISEDGCALADDQMGLEHISGLWQTLQVADFNDDGKIDIIAGNIGNNNRLNPSSEKPASLLVDDFDQNGQTDPLVFYYVGAANIPLMPRSQLGKQLPLLNKRFTTFAEFSRVQSPDDLLPASMNAANKAYIQSSETTLYVQHDGIFEKKKLPPEAQYSTVRSILVNDIDSDGFLDIVLAGNFLRHHVMLGNADAQALSYLKATAEGGYSFTPLTNQFNLRAVYQKLAGIRIGTKDYLIAVRNNGRPDIVRKDSLVSLFKRGRR